VETSAKADYAIHGHLLLINSQHHY